MPDADSSPPSRVVRSYGRGSYLGLISPLLAYVMAARGFNGWQQRTLRDMEDDAAAMAHLGYRVVSSEERSLPLFGATSWTVTYELVEGARPGEGAKDPARRD